MSEYIEKTMEWIKKTNPGQGVFVQAATEVLNSLEPLITSIPLQLLAYHIAVCKGKNVDQPRNLAKSVTVE